jgi:hypothetical protein
MEAVRTGGELARQDLAEGVHLLGQPEADENAQLSAPSPPIMRFRDHDKVGLEWLSASFADSRRTVAFELFYKVGGKEWSTGPAYDGPNMRFTFENITSGYVMAKVRARGSGGVRSGFSNAVGFSTLPGTDVLDSGSS